MPSDTSDLPSYSVKFLSETSWDDRHDQWSDRISAAHPANAGDPHTYLMAMEMVANRHSKGAIVALVNWLLKGRP